MPAPIFCWKICFCLGLLLQAFPALAQSPELVCDPDARVKFQSSWLHGNTVVLEREGQPDLALPWQGLERLVSGRQFQGAGLEAVGENSTFLAFRPKANAPGLQLFVQRELLRGAEQDGLVIAQGNSARTPSSPGESYTLYHCRRR